MTGFPAVFLDRDGVINRDTGYVHEQDQFHFIDGTFLACRQIQEAGYRIIIITNQAGIARGYYTETDFHQLTRWMLQQFSSNGIDITGVYYCPHHSEYGVGEYKRDCDCRKPGPGMILRAATEHSLDLRRSVLVGDKNIDIEAGRRAGVAYCALVRSGHPLSATDEGLADSVFEDLSQFATALGGNLVQPIPVD